MKSALEARELTNSNAKVLEQELIKTSRLFKLIYEKIDESIVNGSTSMQISLSGENKSDVEKIVNVLRFYGYSITYFVSTDMSLLNPKFDEVSYLPDISNMYMPSMKVSW